MKLNKILKPDGQVLISLLVVLPSLILIVAAYLSLSANSFSLSRQDQLHSHAQLAADAGADYAVEQIKADANWNSTSGETELHNDGSIKVTYSATSVDNSPSSKTVTIIGRSYWPADSVNPSSSVTIKVDLRPSESGNYSVVSGQGGLIMSNSSKITGGDVLINGEITLSNSSQIGLSNESANIDVANQICPIPADATYPRLCNAGENDNPISISNSAKIYGTVKANHQSNGSGMSNPGLTASSGVTPQALPAYDRDAHKAAVATTITGSAASCSGSQSKTWAANTKVTGNVTMSNGCQVTIEGNIWITGNLSVSNSSKIKVADSLGGTQPVIMVDGSTGVSLSNGSKIVSNASSIGAKLITYWSSASCSPDCTDVIGTDLNTSRDIRTIHLSNSSEGAQSVFYARWTKLHLSNGGQVGAVVGQTIYMTNSSTVTFGTSTGGGGSTTWVPSGYRRSF